MWAAMFAAMLGRKWARRLAGIGLLMLTITLFLLNLRRTAERAGRAAERLKQMERTNVSTQRKLRRLSR